MMTFNLRRDVPADGPDAWANRRDDVARLILRHAPDLLATQGGRLPMLRDLDARLPGYERVGGAREAWPGEEPNAVYYDPARLAVLDAGVLWLSATPLVCGSRSWGEWAQRSAMWLLVEWLATGASGLVVNTHFDQVSALGRVRSARLLADVAPGAILLGDFNARPLSPVHRILREGRADPLLGAPSTHNAFTGVRQGRIDWILVPRGMRHRGSHIVHDRREDGGPVSDHLPVVVEVPPPATRRPLAAPGWTWTRERHAPTRLPPPLTQAAAG